MKQRLFSALFVFFFFAIFLVAADAAVVSAAEYCSHDYSGGVGVGRCERYISPYNPWRYLSSSEKQLRNDGGYVVQGWPTSTSGKQGTRYCINGVCASFFPKVVEQIVKTGEANKDKICKGFGSNVYTTCADVNVAVQGKPARYEWGTIIRTNGTVPQNWNSEYYYYYYYPQNYKFSNTYPCGYWSGYASTPAPKQYYSPGQYVIQTLSKTVNMPLAYNFHTEYLHLSQGLQLCVLRLFADGGAYQDNWIWITPQFPSPARVTRLTANGSENTAWIAPGDAVTIDWTTDRATQVDVSSTQNDIPDTLNDPYNYNGNISGLTPRKDATYRVYASNAGGSGSKSVEVKIGKPFITRFTANGVQDKVVIFDGQEVRLDWYTESAEEIWINGLSDTTNTKIKTYKTGWVEGLKPSAKWTDVFGNSTTHTFTLRVWNRQWGWGDDVTVTIEVQNPDRVKLLSCLAKGAAFGVTTGVVEGVAVSFGTGLSLACTAGGAAAGSAVPILGTIIGAIVGFIGCTAASAIIAGSAMTVAATYVCYQTGDINSDNVRDIQKGLSVLKSSSSSFSLEPPKGPPTIDLSVCPPGKCTFDEGNPPIPFDSLSGPIIINAGGANPYENYLQKIAAENSARVNQDKLFLSKKVPGYKELPVGLTLTNTQAKAIIGHCGLSRACIRNDVKAALGITLTDSEFNRMFMGLNIFAGKQL